MRPVSRVPSPGTAPEYAAQARAGGAARAALTHHCSTKVTAGPDSATSLRRPVQRPFRRRELADATALLLAACQRDPDARDLAARARQLDDGAACDRFVELADAHGVLGLALATLDRTGSLHGRRASAALGSVLHGLRRRAALLQLERENVLRTLEQHGLDAVVLKGAALATTIYANPVERNFGDIDLLLSPESLPLALDVLQRAGYHPSGSAAVVSAYREHHFHIRVERGHGSIVELHWALVAPHEPYHLDEAAFLAQSRTAQNRSADHPVNAIARRFRTPRPEHTLMHIVVENVRNGFSRLTRIVDVDRIVTAAPEMDWDLVQSVARGAQVLPGLALALDMSRTLFGTEIPRDVTRALRPTPMVRFHLALLRPVPSLLRQRATTRAAWGTLLQFWLSSGRSRGSVIARMLRGDDADPLDWVWSRGEEGAPARPALSERLLRAQKLALYQLGIYVVGFATGHVGIRRFSKPQLRDANTAAPGRISAADAA